MKNSQTTTDKYFASFLFYLGYFLNKLEISQTENEEIETYTFANIPECDWSILHDEFNQEVAIAPSKLFDAERHLRAIYTACKWKHSGLWISPRSAPR